MARPARMIDSTAVSIRIERRQWQRLQRIARQVAVNLNRPYTASDLCRDGIELVATDWERELQELQLPPAEVD